MNKYLLLVYNIIGKLLRKTFPSTKTSIGIGAVTRTHTVITTFIRPDVIYYKE